MAQLIEEQSQELEAHEDAMPELEQEAPAGLEGAQVCPTCGGALTAHEQGSWCTNCQAWQQ